MLNNKKNPDFKTGEWVLAYSGWQLYAVSDGSDLTKLGKKPENPSYALGILGMPGFTAYMGLLDIGKPKAGDTLVVAAAAGPVGATVGQIGRLKGCRVVGVAGTAQKCSYAKETLGFDECLDHKDPDLADLLKQACPDGIDIYYENVGGKVFDAALPLLNTKARIPVCGLISQYNATKPPLGPSNLGHVISKQLTIQGFLVGNYFHKMHQFQTDMGKWIAEGRITWKETVLEGIEKAPEAFIGLFKGENFGKMIVKL